MSAICLLLFAFSTILSWNQFGKINAVCLFGGKNPKLAATVYNVIALFALTGLVVKGAHLDKK